MRSWLALLVLTGCFQRYEPIRTAARAERRQQPEAEALWVKALSQPLAGVEWRTSHRHLCRLRGERITAEVQSLDPATVDVAAIRALRSQLDHCNKWDETLGRLALLEENRALQAFTAVQVQPDHAHLYEAYPHVRALSEKAPQRDTYATWLQAWVDHLKALPRTGPATALLVDRRLAEAGQPVTPDEGAVVAATTVGDGTLALTAEGTCASLVQPRSTPAGDARIRSDETQVLFACESTTSARLVDVPYQVQKFRTEMQEVTKTGTRMVNESVRVYSGENCYQTSENYQTCFPQYSWTTRSRPQSYTYTVQEPVQVPYYETEYRKETRHRRVGTASLRVTTQSPHGTSVRTVQLSHQEDGVAPVAEGAFFQAAYDEALPAVRQQSRALAAGWFAQFLRDHADLTTPAGVENRLLLTHVGRALSAEDRVAIGATLGIPVAALQGDRPQLDDITVVPLRPDDVAAPRPVDNDGVLAFGFPLISTTLGGGRSTGFDDLAAHRTPRSYQLMFREEFQYALMARTPLGGFGLHVGAYGAAQVGWRSQKRYTFPPPDPFRGESEPEPRIAYEFHGGVQALMGTRNSLFGLFAGVHPRVFYGRIGYAGTGGIGLPLLVRLELRPVPRMPIFVSAWGYDLADPERPLDTYGANVMLPLSRGIWLSGEHSRGRGRTQVSGLFDEDRIEAGIQPWTRTWVGVTLGF